MLVKPFGFYGAAAGAGGIGYGNPPYDQDLVAYYDFGDNTDGSWTGGTSLSDEDTVTDLSGNGFDSTLQAGSQTWTYDSTVGKGVIATDTKGGGYFFMDALSGAFASLTAYTFEFVCYLASDLANDNLIMRFDNGGFTRAESNLQQYGSPPKRIGFDTITQQNNNVSVGTNNQAVLNIMLSIKDKKKKIKFFQSLSSEVFKKNKRINLCNEKTKLDINNAYSISKISSYNYLKLLRKKYKLKLYAGFLFNHASYYSKNDFLIKKIVGNFHKLKTKKLKKIMVGNLNAKRDWIYSKDLVEIIWKVTQLRNQMIL